MVERINDRVDPCHELLLHHQDPRALSTHLPHRTLYLEGVAIRPCFDGPAGEGREQREVWLAIQYSMISRM